MGGPEQGDCDCKRIRCGQNEGKARQGKKRKREGKLGGVVGCVCVCICCRPQQVECMEVRWMNELTTKAKGNRSLFWSARHDARLDRVQRNE
jgi:hypothetical protein